MFGGSDEADIPAYPIFSKVVGTFFILAVIAFSIMVFVTFSELNGRTKLFGEGSLPHNYQTLIAGLLAFVGAALGVWSLDRERRDRLARKLRAARSAMPFALTAVCDYACAAGKYAQSFRHLKAANEAPPPPLMDPSAIVALKEVVEYADRQWASKIADLMNDLQVVQSRAKNIPNHLRHAPSFARFADPLLADAAALENKASNLFDYARQETEEPKELRPINMRSFRAKAYVAQPPRSTRSSSR